MPGWNTLHVGMISITYSVASPGVTAPRRGAVMPYLPTAHAAAPHGDMMLSGSFGLLDSFAYRIPQAQEAGDGLLDSQAPRH